MARRPSKPDPLSGLRPGSPPQRETAIRLWVPRLARYIEECVGTSKAAQLLREAADGLERGGTLPGDPPR